MRSPFPSNRQNGFTLVEMLVALAVMSLIFAALSGGLRLGSATWQKVDTELQAISAFERASRLVGQFVGRAVMPAPNSTIQFVGRPTEMSFPAILPAYPGAGGPNKVTFKIEPDEDRALLSLVRRPIVGTKTLGQGYDASLTAVPTDLRFTYWHPETGWRSEWTAGNGMPYMIRLNSQMDPQWANILLRTHSAVAADCVQLGSNVAVTKCFGS